MKNSIIIFLFVICSLLSGICNAQTQFQLAIGGTGNDAAYSIIRTIDGGYALAGSTTSVGSGYDDMYIVKLDTSGSVQWSRTIGETNIQDGAYSIIQTTDGGYAVAGGTFVGAVSYDMYIVKLDGSGTLQWNKTVGGTNIEYAWFIIQTTDGGYVVAGYTTSFGAGSYDMYIVKLDGAGTLQWNKTVGGTNIEYAWSIIQTIDGGYALAGSTTSFGAGYYDMYIVKLDASGTLQWNKTVGGTGEEYAWSIIQTTDGGYAVAGYTSTFGAGNNDMYIVKLDTSGTLQWSRTVGGTFGDWGYSIIQTTDGGYAVAGYTQSFGEGNDMYIVKLNGSGTLQWSRIIGGTSDDRPSSIIQTTDGGYAVAGFTRSFGAGNNDMYIVKLDASGNTCGNSSSPPSISGTGGTTNSPTSTVISPTPTVTTPTPSTNTGGTVTTICTFVGIQPVSNEIPKEFLLMQNYPNPFNPTTKIRFDIPSVGQRHAFDVRLIIYDILGRETAVLLNEQLSPGSYEVDFNGSNFPSGVYYYKLEAGDYSETKKMVLVK